MVAARRDGARGPLARALIGACLVVVHGCSLVLDVEDEQCASDTDCVGLFGRAYTCNAERVCVERASTGGDAGGAGMLPPGLACTTEPPRMVAPLSGRKLTLRMVVTDFIDLNVPAGLVGRACNDTDVSCSRPRLEDLTPDDDGYLTFEGLPHGWLGYLQLEAPGYLQTLVYTNKPYTVDAMPEGPTLLTEDDLRSISEGGGERIDETRGIVLLSVYDCEGTPAEGITFIQEDAANEEPAFYFEGSLPDRDRTSTIISRRLTRSGNPLAVGGFSQVRAGYVTLIGVHEATGQEIGRVSVQVRPLTMTIAELHAGY